MADQTFEVSDWVVQVTDDIVWITDRQGNDITLTRAELEEITQRANWEG